MPTLLVPADSRSLAMGGVALPKDASKLDVQAFYGMWAPKSANNSVFGGDVFFRVSKRVAVSVEGRYFADKPYDVTTAQGQVTGTYIHGIFDHDTFRRQVLNALRGRKGLADLPVQRSVRQEKERAYNRLASVVRASLDMEKLAQIMGETSC